MAYLQSLKIVHPIQGRVPWTLYPHQISIIRNKARQRLIVKAREIGVSQVICGEALYDAKYAPESRIVFISRNGQEAKELISYCRVLASEDPDLGDPGGSQELRIPAFNRRTCDRAVSTRGVHLTSRLVSEAASRSAGRGGGKRRIYVDEYAHGNFIFWGNDIYQSVRPSITLGGAVTIVSTPKGKNNMFYRLYREALAGLNQFQILNYPWDVCPIYNPKGFHLEDPEQRRLIGETSEWYLSERPAYSDAEWAEEYGCDFTSSAGLIYPEFNELLSVGDFAYNPHWLTYFGQDFGFNNPSVALAIQVSPSEDIFVIKEHYATRRSVASLAKEEYTSLAASYRPTAWYCDPADPMKIVDMQEAGLPAEPAPRREVRDGINEVRKLFRVPLENKPRIFIDRGCTQLITDLVTYAYKPDKDEPEKDVNDHGPDALRYFVESFRKRAIVGNSYTWSNDQLR
jgi:hypothetical protein